MDKGNYRIVVTLKEADVGEAREIIDDLVTTDYDIDVGSFDVELYEETGDGNWNPIGFQSV